MKTGQLLAALLVFVPSYSVSGFSVDTVRRRNNNDVVVKNTREATVVRPKRKQSSSSSSRVSAEQGNLPPVLQDIANDRMEFQRKLGKAMDTLRRDMQDILTKTPGMHDAVVL
jgi:formate dehydrogenase assembly factor FdhD